MYSAQLLKPDGVMALLRNTFGSDETEERGLMQKLSSLGHLLSSPPPGMPFKVSRLLQSVVISFLDLY